MKIVEKTDDILVMQATPWISIVFHGVLGIGFLMGFLTSAWVAQSIWLTLGMATCLALILRVFLFSIAAVTVRFDRPADQVTLAKRMLRGRTTATYMLSTLSAAEVGHDSDGDADRVILRFGPGGSEAVLPANSSGFFASSGQAEGLLQTIRDWRGAD